MYEYRTSQEKLKKELEISNINLKDSFNYDLYAKKTNSLKALYLFKETCVDFVNFKLEYSNRISRNQNYRAKQLLKEGHFNGYIPVNEEYKQLFSMCMDKQIAGYAIISGLSEEIKSYIENVENNKDENNDI